MSYTLELPIKVRISSKKIFTLNLNAYRNLHYQQSNKAKQSYKELIQDKLKVLPKFEKVHLTYTLYKKSQHMCDVSNFCSIVDKFFCDALVEYGYLPDDDIRYIPQVTYIWGGIDKENPRCEVKIEEII